MTVYCLFQYGTTAELVPIKISQRPAVVLTNGDAEKIRFKERCTTTMLDYEILILKKLLLPYTNPKIDRETEGEFNARMILQRSNFGVIFEHFKKASECLQKLSRHAQEHSRVIFRPIIEEKYRLDFYSASLPSRN